MSMKPGILFVAACVIVAGFATPSIADEAAAQKAVLITGASTGIGRNAAEKLAAEGYFVYAGARKAKDIEDLNKIENVMAVRLDVTSQDEIDAAMKLIEGEGRGLWGVLTMPVLTSLGH
jgi:NAD(P)-dependent dehydrogenase (short-subunit alcohol dehydrogenase family)